MSEGTQNKPAKASGRLSLAGAVIGAIAASACCLGPLLLVALGVGGAWASRLRAVEPFRPLFLALSITLLAFAFYRAYARAGTSCGADGSCEPPRTRRISRAVLWVVAVLVVGLLAFPYLARGLMARCNRSAGAGTQPAAADCCVIPGSAGGSAAQTSATGEKTPFNVGREAMFSVETLECPLVPGIGCGHLLAPIIGRINRIEGIERSFTNWTGDRIRIVAAKSADRDAAAERARTLLDADSRKPVHADRGSCPSIA